MELNYLFSLGIAFLDHSYSSFIGEQRKNTYLNIAFFDDMLMAYYWIVFMWVYGQLSIVRHGYNVLDLYVQGKLKFMLVY